MNELLHKLIIEAMHADRELTRVRFEIQNKRIADLEARLDQLEYKLNQS